MPYAICYNYAICHILYAISCHMLYAACYMLNALCHLYPNQTCDGNPMRPGDGEDNDCDGRIDEEMENGIDDDGDYRIDEDLGVAPTGYRYIFVSV